MFLDWLIAEGNTDPDPSKCQFSRHYLRAVAFKHGMMWAPAWIVKDKTRVTIRGVYNVHELSEYILSKQAPAVSVEAPTVSGAD